MADSYLLTFHWPRTDANTVIATGTFDNWGSTLHLKRDDQGFTGSVSVPWESKIIYKFIVDGNWVTHPDQPTEWDASGNLNNVLQTPSKPVAPQPAEEKEVDEVAPEETKVKSADDSQPKAKEEAQTPSEVVPAVPVSIEPVADGNNDIPEKKPADFEHGPSTHTPVPAITESGAEEPKALGPAVPSTPPQKEVEVPETPSAPSAPVTPVKTNGAGHARTSTGTSTPPSSIAPSTPKTQSTFPGLGTDKESPSPNASLGRREKRTSIFGRLKGVFSSPGKEKKGRLGGESPRSASPSPRKSDK